MFHSDIDPKDLRQFKASELLIGGTFYLKLTDRFERMKIDEADLESDRVDDIRRLTKKYSEEGKLYVRINKPWKSFQE